MTTKPLVATLLAMALATAGSIAFAQGYSNDRGRYDGDRRGNDARQHDRGRGHMHREWNGQEWRKGARLPAEYRHRQYYVNDWRSHRLSAPPRGYRWVQHGNDYVLVAVTSGVIAQLLLNHR